MTSPARADRPQASSSAAPASRRWLLFVHQLPSNPSNLRVSTWRRLQQIGAVPLKQAVYVLPDSPITREDFEWLKAEVKGAGGDASVFAADNLDTSADDDLVDEFRRSRQEVYGALAHEIDGLLKRLRAGGKAQRRRAPAASRLLTLFRERFRAIESIDFFGSAGRDRVSSLLQQLQERTPEGRRARAVTETADRSDSSDYRGRLWITRPRPGVDRMASAWLIRRFIDPDARFGFAADREAVPDGGVPFDMFGVEFGHQGDGCTFETLCAVFAIDNQAVSRIAAIVHDLDLKDERFGAPECATVGAMIDGLQLSHQADDALLAQGMTLFDSLYRSFERTERAAGPRLLAKSAKRPGRARDAAGRRKSR